MADWILIACLKQLFAEFDRIAPDRGHESDGSIGDTAHQQEVSDHNDDEVGKVPIHDADHIHEVHAIDVDTDLRVPGLTMETVVQHVLSRCRSGAENRLRYVIYYRRIWEADNGWRERAYTGASAHTEHAHFSASYDTDKEASTASWHLEELVADDSNTVWSDQVIPVHGGKDKWSGGGTLGATFDRTDAVLSQVRGNGTSLSALTSAVADLNRKVDQLIAALPAGGGGA